MRCTASALRPKWKYLAARCRFFSTTKACNAFGKQNNWIGRRPLPTYVFGFFREKNETSKYKKKLETHALYANRSIGTHKTRIFLVRPLPEFFNSARLFYIKNSTTQPLVCTTSQSVRWNHVNYPTTQFSTVHWTMPKFNPHVFSTPTLALSR